MHTKLQAGKFVLDLSVPNVMGILNVTPDSFSDGGEFNQFDKALDYARLMQEQGAHIIDIGGQSTRPGSERVDESEELRRVIPLIEQLAKELTIPLSIDTEKPEVAKQAVWAGASMVNDIYAARQPGMLACLAELNVPVCLMHMKGTPRNMQNKPTYFNVVSEVNQFLQERVMACEAMDIHRERIIVDPGLGFGKTPEHNLTLLKHLDEFSSLGLPVLMGCSRKSTIGWVLNKPVEQRLVGSLACACMAVTKGAQLLRVHDVAETIEAVKMTSAILSAN